MEPRVAGGPFLPPPPLSRTPREPVAGSGKEERAVAYREWETHLCERHVASRRSGASWPVPVLRHPRPSPGIARRGNAGRTSRRLSRGHACVGLRWLQHQLNALHLMAALVRWGVPRPWALALARRWERASHAWLYAAEP